MHLIRHLPGARRGIHLGLRHLGHPGVVAVVLLVVLLVALLVLRRER